MTTLEQQAEAKIDEAWVKIVNAVWDEDGATGYKCFKEALRTVADQARKSALQDAANAIKSFPHTHFACKHILSLMNEPPKEQDCQHEWKENNHEVIKYICTKCGGWAETPHRAVGG